MPVSRNQLVIMANDLKKVLAFIESLIAEQNVNPESANYRRRPGGPLNERGEAEIERRFEAGFSDSEIALAMDISLSGVAKRRGLWRRGTAK